MVKRPLPLHPVPVADQEPAIVLPVAVPVRVMVFDDWVLDCTLNPKLPVTFPLKLPVSENDPVSVVPPLELMHGDGEVMVKLLTAKVPSPWTTSAVPNWKNVWLFVSVSMAVHVPLMFAGLLLLDPQPTNAAHTPNNTTAATCFIENLESEIRVAHNGGPSPLAGAVGHGSCTRIRNPKGG